MDRIFCSSICAFYQKRKLNSAINACMDFSAPNFKDTIELTNELKNTLQISLKDQSPPYVLCCAGYDDGLHGCDYLRSRTHVRGRQHSYAAVFGAVGFGGCLLCGGEKMNYAGNLL